MKENVLIFGSSGTLGSAIYEQLKKENYDIYTSGKIYKKIKKGRLVHEIF